MKKILFVLLIASLGANAQTYLCREAQQNMFAAALVGSTAITAPEISALHHAMLDMKGSIIDGSTTFVTDQLDSALIIYNILGSNSFGHSINLKTHTNSTTYPFYGQTFTGSPTHTAGLITFNGTSQYAIANIQDTSLRTTSNNICIYVKSLTAASGTSLFGSNNSTTFGVSAWDGWIRSTPQQAFVSVGETNNGIFRNATNPTAPYVYQGNNDGTNVKLAFGGTVVSTISYNGIGVSFCGNKIFIGAANVPSACSPPQLTPIGFTNCQIGTVIIGRSLNGTQGITDQANLIAKINSILGI